MVSSLMREKRCLPAGLVIFLSLKAFFQIHPQSIGQTINKGKIGRHGANIMNGSIIESAGTQSGHVVRVHFPRAKRHFGHVIQHHHIAFR